VTGRTLSIAFLGTTGLGIAVCLLLIGGGSGVSNAVRWGLVSVVGGLLGYDLYALGLPRALRGTPFLHRWGALVAAGLGCAVALAVYALGTLMGQRFSGED
jgi:hypothetical protein